MEEKKKKITPEELIQRYNIDIEKLKKEQIELAKQLSLSDSIDFKRADTFGAVMNRFVQNTIVSCIIVCNSNWEILDSVYVRERVRFPYLTGFRSYRELPSMVKAFEKLDIRPDVFLIPAQGITHSRLGLASHFSLMTGIPAIGVSEVIIDCKIMDEDIIKLGEKVGKMLQSKEKSRPLYISPGNNISINSALDLCKKLIVPPHKHPEPIHLVSKYVKGVKKELYGEH